MNPEIIANEKNYLVINKPPFMGVEPPSKYPTIREWLVQKDYIKKNDFTDNRLGVVHRLDEQTSGVLVWAKSQKSCDYLRLLWKGRRVSKTYLAVVIGKIEREVEIDYNIVRRSKKGFYRCAFLSQKGSRVAVTKVKPLAYVNYDKYDLSLLSCQPITGRTHQIRVHLQAINSPILGDMYYHNKISQRASKHFGIERHFLHHYQLCLDKNLCYKAPLPLDMNNFATEVFGNPINNIITDLNNNSQL